MTAPGTLTRLLRAALLLLLTAMAPAAGAATPAPTGVTAFDAAMRFYYAEKYEEAAANLYRYLVSAGDSGDKTENARFFLGESLAKLGFHYAATEYYYDIAKERRAPEFVAPALEALEKITRERPFDEVLIIDDLIYDSPLGTVSEDIDDWLSYYRGVENYRHNLERWGRESFASIRPGTHYWYKARYVEAIWNLRTGGTPEDSLKILQEVVDAAGADEEVRNLARHGYARLLFEKGDYAAAFAAYDKIRGDVRTAATILLEKAWAKFYLGDYRKAMGLLLALDAPMYGGFFAPEKYVLRALILKSYCHYRAAKAATAAFRTTYAKALKTIRERTNLATVPEIYDAAVQEGELKRADAFLSTLLIERKAVSEYPGWKAAGLTAGLTKMYDLKEREVRRRIDTAVKESTRRVAEALLDFDEQMNILDYEIGLDLYRRIRAKPSATSAEIEGPAIPKFSDKVYYRFEGEYWIDEFHDLSFDINDRCVE
ncbi:MAG TPA: hypothetical protein VG389_01385 [Myxococcota bacterium]|jgi:hypothetical protein|nr:hypothetical protein [Myxococcota bacterium]